MQNSENLPPQKSWFPQTINPSNFHQFQEKYNHPPYGFALQVLLWYNICNYIVRVHGNKGLETLANFYTNYVILEILKTSKSGFFLKKKNCSSKENIEFSRLFDLLQWKIQNLINYLTSMCWSCQGPTIA